MKLNAMTTSMFLALSIAGCAAVEEDTVEPPLELQVCDATSAPCTGDTICGEHSCEPAFDRAYRIRVASIWVSSTKRLDICDGDPACAVPSLAVFFSELDDPILTSPQPDKTAEVMVPKGSYLVVDVADDTCLVDLTAERLSAGTAGCTGSGASISLSIDRLPAR